MYIFFSNNVYNIVCKYTKMVQVRTTPLSYTGLFVSQFLLLPHSFILYKTSFHFYTFHHFVTDRFLLHLYLWN